MRSLPGHDAPGRHPGILRVIPLALLSALLLVQPASALDAGMPGPPASPTNVKVGIFLADIVSLDEVNETFEAEFVIGARWVDPRLAFDPVEEGSDEKRFQG